MTKFPRHWAPLQESKIGLWRPQVIAQTAKDYNVSEEEAYKMLEKDSAKCTYWVNHLYQVERRDLGNGIIQLNIRRRDGAADLRDWRHFQEIKNQLVGPECEGIEVYPAESRKVDTANKWHLFVHSDPTYRVPVGWNERDVQYEEHKDVPGMKQRPL